MQPINQSINLPMIILGVRYDLVKRAYTLYERNVDGKRYWLIEKTEPNGRLIGVLLYKTRRGAKHALETDYILRTIDNVTSL
jgi:hypothetical protein